MQRILSTYLFVSKKLTRELLGQVRDGGFQAVEIFVNDGRRLRLGTDEPELLRKAILTAQMETQVPEGSGGLGAQNP